MERVEWAQPLETRGKKKDWKCSGSRGGTDREDFTEKGIPELGSEG